MATEHTFRILCIARVDRAAAVATWLNANIAEGEAAADLGPGLNATGNPADAVTHRWFCGAYRDDEARRILVRLCQLAGITPPTQGTWDGWTRPEKISWLKGLQVQLWTGWVLGVDLMANDADWDDLMAEAARVNLVPITGG